MTRYFLTPRAALVFNPKAASTTLARAIIRTHWPEVEIALRMARGRAVEHELCPQTPHRPDRPVALVIRDPVARFRSAMVQVRRADAAAVLAELEAGGPLAADVHFSRQASRAAADVRVFPIERIDDAAAFLGLPVPLVRRNPAASAKPELTAREAGRVRDYYAADVELRTRFCPLRGSAGSLRSQ